MQSNIPNSEELRIIESQKEIRFHPGYTMDGNFWGNYLENLYGELR